MGVTLSRREFLGAMSAMAMAPHGDADGFVDSHSHIWTRDVAKFPLADDQKLADLKPGSFTDAELLKACEPHGVSRVVLIQHTIYHRFDNSYITDAIRRHPGRFSAVAVIDDKAGGVKARMLQLRKQGVRGFRIVPRNWHGSGSFAPDQWLSGAGMHAMWKVAGEHGMAMCPLINPEYIESVGAMSRRYPTTRVVVDHFARIGIDGTIRDKHLKNLCDLARQKNVFVKVSAFYALGKKQPPYTDLIPMIRRVLDAFGPERLMWGSDAPYQVEAPHTYRASVELVTKKLDFLSATDRDWLLRRTAEGVFFGP